MVKDTTFGPVALIIFRTTTVGNWGLAGRGRDGGRVATNVYNFSTEMFQSTPCLIKTACKNSFVIVLFIPGEGGICPVAHYCPVNSSLPTACAPGFYNNLTGQSECFTCVEGYYCLAQTTHYIDFDCPLGK